MSARVVFGPSAPMRPVSASFAPASSGEPNRVPTLVSGKAPNVQLFPIPVLAAHLLGDLPGSHVRRAIPQAVPSCWSFFLRL